MIQYFQKTANDLQELPALHPGIIDSRGFSEHFQLHCYKPPPDLEPFVVHIWVQRQQRPIRPTQRPPIEVLSGPNIYLFFTAKMAFIHGITQHTFQYDAFGSKVISGVKFRPGGFYPFLQRSTFGLDAATSPITSIFPTANEAFKDALLSQTDATIVARLEALLRSKKPEHNRNLELVAKILDTIDNDTSLVTVGLTAKAFHMSERSLQLLFQTHVGVGLKWVITRKRLLKAIAQIKMQPDSSQADITARLGYNSQSHFTREFKEVIGQSPSRYLKSLK